MRSRGRVKYAADPAEDSARKQARRAKRKAAGLLATTAGCVMAPTNPNQKCNKLANTVTAQAVPVGMKRCPQCGETKPVTEFGPDERRRDGLRCRCKTCRAAAQRARYAADPSKGNVRRRAWRMANLEQARAYGRARYAANTAWAQAYQRARRAELQARGLCTGCGRTSPTTKLYCANCAAKRREYRLRYRYGLDFAARAAILRERDART